MLFALFSPEPRSLIAELDDSLEVLLRILQDYDMLSKKYVKEVILLERSVIQIIAFFMQIFRIKNLLSI